MNLLDFHVKLDHSGNNKYFCLQLRFVNIYMQKGRCTVLKLINCYLKLYIDN